MEVKTGDFVLPGDFLATSEEFVPGEGAYEEDGKIYSSTVGMVLVDIRTKKISVFPKTKTPPTLKIGDVVIGRVEEVRDQFLMVSIAALVGRENRELPPPRLGIVHISKVQAGFVKELGKLFKPGDIIKAKVLSVQPEILQLTTIGRDLGVLVALCSRCRTPLDREGNKLKCPSCGSVEARKISANYRQGAVR
jgi:exosome complex component CSL4